MAKLEVPRWLITQLCMPYGVRQSKKPTLAVKTSTASSPSRGFTVYTYGGRFSEYVPAVFPGVFDSWEYRFWSCSPHEPLVTECRACGNVVVSFRDARKLHASLSGCFKKLVAAYQLLRRDKRCVICDSPTGKEKWGIPLCAAACMKAWCEVETTPEALALALQLIGDVK